MVPSMTKTLSRLAVAALAATSLSLAVGSGPAAAIAPITIDSIVMNGSGCPVGTAEAMISGDNESVTIIYSEYVIETPTRQKNCVLVVDLNVPDGYTIAIGGVDYYGFKLTAASTTSSVWTQYRWQAAGYTAFSFTNTIPGGIGPWETHDIMAADWSNCHEDVALVVSTRVVMNGVAGDLITMDSQDAQFSTLFNLVMAPC